MARVLFAIGALFLSAVTCAQDGSNGSQSDFFSCEATLANEVTFFTSIHQEALRVNEAFCQRMNSEPGLPHDLFEGYGLFLERVVAGIDFGSARLNSHSSSAVSIMSGALGDNIGGRLRAPDFFVDALDEGEFNANGGSFYFNVSVLTENFFEPSANEEHACQRSFARIAEGEPPSCVDIFKDLSVAINSYKRSFTKHVAADAAQELATKSAEWERFFEEARTPSFLDLWLTSLMERNHIRKGFFVGPPKRQWFALRPNVILQYHEGAPQGDQFEPGLSLEWIGVNWWRKSPIGVPFGVSVTSVYADVPEVKTVGTGLTVHVMNRFTLGWARHGNDNSYHLSADLLQFFKDKQARFDDYKSRFGALLE